jgi:hypothetical protein
MTFRKLLLRLMLGLLALSALLGVVAVLVAGRDDIVWRVVGTGLCAAGAAGVLLVLSLLTDQPKSRAAGLAGMIAAVAAFVLSLMLIWDLHVSLSEDWAEGLTLLLTLGAAPPVMFFLRVMQAERMHWAGIAGVVGCGTAVVLILIAIWSAFTGFNAVQENLIGSGWAISLYGIVIAGCLAGLGADRRPWRWVGVVAAIVGCAMALVGIWKQLDQGSTAFVAVTGLAVVVAHANLACLCPLTLGQRWVRWGTIAATAATSLLIDLVVLTHQSIDVVARCAGAAAIAAGCGSIALLVLAALNRKISVATVPANVKAVALTCPWCQCKLSLPLGASSCAGCGLKFKIAIEEPRCPKCDYLLFMLTSDRCPECGTIVRAVPIQAQPVPVTS